MTSGVEFAFGSCLTEDITLMSKKISTQVKEANTRLKKTNKSISEIAKTLEVSKSTIWSILVKEEHVGELNIIKNPATLLKDN